MNTPNSQELLIEWMKKVSESFTGPHIWPIGEAFLNYKISLLQPASDSVPSAPAERKAREWWLEIRPNNKITVWNEKALAYMGSYPDSEVVHVGPILPSEEVNHGEGYRPLVSGEVIRPDDEAYGGCGKWGKTIHAGKKVREIKETDFIYRRSISK